MSDLNEKAVYFLGYFLGVASRSGPHGMYAEDWRTTVQLACDLSGLGELKWLTEMKEEKANEF